MFADNSGGQNWLEIGFLKTNLPDILSTSLGKSCCLPKLKEQDNFELFMLPLPNLNN